MRVILSIFILFSVVINACSTEVKPSVSANKFYSDESLDNALQIAYENNKTIQKGKNADYIPLLAEVPKDLFGIAIMTADGRVFSQGDVDYNFTIQSISKVFLLADIIESSGTDEVVHKVGINITGKNFDSIDVLEETNTHLSNPMLNAGAIATTSLVSGSDYVQKYNNIIDSLSRFVGRKLTINQAVYESESKTNQRNKSIAYALESYGKIYADAIETVDLYTRQCALSINTKELATMAATLANGGFNPQTGEQVITPETAAKVLQVMVTFGLYNNSGQWFYEVGLPVKSGVSGSVIAVVPGQFAIAAFSPPLDEYGNSVKAQRAIADIIKELNINPYLIQPVIKN